MSARSFSIIKGLMTYAPPVGFPGVANIAVHFGADGAIQGASLQEVRSNLQGSQNLVPKGPEEASVAWLPACVFLTTPIVGKRRRGEVSPGCRPPPLVVEVRAVRKQAGVKRRRLEMPPSGNDPKTNIQCNSALPAAAYGRQKWIVRVGRRFRAKTAYTPQGRVVDYSVNIRGRNNRRPPCFKTSWRTPAGVFGRRLGITSQQGPSLAASVREVAISAEVVASASTNEVTRDLAFPGGSVGQSSGSDSHSASDVIMGETSAEEAPTSVAAEAPVSTESRKRWSSLKLHLGPFMFELRSGGESLVAMQDDDDEDLPDAEEAKVEETAMEVSHVENSTAVETTAAGVSGENSAVMTVPPSKPSPLDVMSKVPVGYAVETVASSSECPQRLSQAAQLESSSSAMAPGVAVAPASSSSSSSGVTLASPVLGSEATVKPNPTDVALVRAMGSFTFRETHTLPKSSANPNTSRTNPVRKFHEMSKRLTAALASKTPTPKSGGIQKLGVNKVEVGKKFHRADDPADEREAERRRRMMRRAKMPFYESDTDEEAS
ncbi:hypothetical protein L211DRAFT_865389 [Terfezia boudieri ATCC MYA-4762]|uniref:Uncharacterized protein n=1 Tax=Terfezia boudieri ATCC MYA-4762 TaxID=1051890 RepID=A0A3N4M1X0_9PEZI|nr:hypothetical protein L211DRAFT_865389 [Terfezia boudieri ATCC MYA-4762]